MLEALVALLLGLFLVHVALSTGAKARALHRDIVIRAEALAAVRMVSTLLRAETGAGVPVHDWAAGGDSLWVRAFRGTGLTCRENGAAEPGSTFWVAYTGYRRPDPTKDSVLVMYPSGDSRLAALAGVAGAIVGCAQDRESGLRLTVSEELPPGGVVVRVFERGSYALSGAALRYRRGAGGRQPLTPELWDAGSGWRHQDGRMEVELVPSTANGADRGLAPWWLAIHPGFVP